jgi:cellulose synthase/poly-beta-1,6-N-acetylglucosamine synthase-like glycosyltransferase
LAKESITPSAPCAREDEPVAAPAVSVIVCAYTEQRWEHLRAAVSSAAAQRPAPVEIIVCIDHNDALFERARRELARDDGGVPVQVVANAYAGRLGSARTTAAQLARGDLLVFLDDDARAEPSWLEHLVRPYHDPDVLAVGGAPLPDMPRPRPRWFPYEFDWVFGCAYAGLPTQLAPLRHLIGASMSVRRAALAEIGWFHSDDHDDMDMCHRLAARWPDGKLLYEPSAVVRHYVHPERLTWHYFWRRCFFVNRSKVFAHQRMGEARNLSAERSFALRALTRGVAREGRALVRGDASAAMRAGAIVLGLGCAGAGYLSGTLESSIVRDGSRRPPRA